MQPIDHANDSSLEFRVSLRVSRLLSEVGMTAGTTGPRATYSGRRIVIPTWGSLGDLHPYLAIGLGLKALGHDVILGTGECYRRKIEALGLGFRAVRPDCAWLTDPTEVRRIAHPRWGMIRAAQMVLMALRESYEDTLAAAQGADLLVSNLVTLAARLVAEKMGIPWASAMHVPTLFYSAHDPPLIPGFPGLSKTLRFLGPTFWGPLGRFVTWATRWLATPWFCLRQDIGLPPAPDVNPLVDGHSPWLHLALFSKRLLDKQPDWPAQTLVTGFPWYDQDSSPGLPPALVQFLDDGPAPLVFTLGTAIAADAGPFFEASARAAHSLRRAGIGRGGWQTGGGALSVGIARHPEPS